MRRRRRRRGFRWKMLPAAENWAPQNLCANKIVRYSGPDQLAAGWCWGRCNVFSYFIYEINNG